MASGNHQIILCERGIRTYERATRNTLDITAVPILKQETHLPVMVDVTHSTGRRDLLLPAAKAALAVGADGVMVEVNNVGGMAQPFDVELYYDDDTMESFRQNPVIWRDSPKVAAVEIETPKEVMTVTLNGGIYLDYTPTDNTWSAP